MLIKKPYNRQKIIFFLFGMTALFLFAACRKEPATTEVTPPPELALSPAPELTPSAEATPLPETTPEPVPTKPLQKSEEELQHLLETEHGFSVFHSEYRDFDGNGTYEMFAFVLETELTEQYTEEWLYGKLVYLNNTAELKELTMPFYIWDISAIRVLTLKDRLFLAIDEAFVSETVSRVYAVYEDEPQCVMSGFGYFFVQDDSAMVNISDYDMYVEQNGFATGHTWKNYYFRYDDEKRCFYEYTAKQITEEDFLAFPGTTSLLEELKKRYGAETEFEFLYRENGVLHVNIFYQEMGATVQKNCSARLRGSLLEEWEENNGRYRISGTESGEWE